MSVHDLLELQIRQHLALKQALRDVIAALRAPVTGRTPDYDLACRDIAQLLHTALEETPK